MTAADMATLARAHGGPFGRGMLRVEYEDFEVREELGFEPAGVGEHWLLQVEKCDLNTLDVAHALARAAGVPLRDVGFSGLKDRRAVAVQWYSVPARRGADPGWSGQLHAGMKLLRMQRHQRKLRRGTHRSNRFHIRVRELDADRDALAAGLERIASGGFPNYFGEQRLGRRNLEIAERWFAGGRARLGRQQRSLALSAVRAWLFNLVLSERVAGGSWDRLLPGDVANLDGTGSVFPVDHPDAGLTQRCAELDLHPTGPLHGVIGSRDCVPTAGVAELEASVVAAYGAWCDGLEAHGVRAGRRPLRAAATGLVWDVRDGLLEMEFALPRGVYATALLREALHYTNAVRRDVSSV